MATPLRAYLSVDWDFFVRSLGQWDWGHQESPFFRTGAMWTIRVSDFIRQGIDLTEEMSPEEHARPRPETFWGVLEQLDYDFSDVETFIVADTHAGAAPVFNQMARESGEPDVIINFDAHHDVGYKPWKELKHFIESGQCACDNWLCSFLCGFPNTKARIIFPDWLREDNKLKDEINSIRKALPRKMWSRVRASFFTNENGAIDSLVSNYGELIEVAAIYVCRSGAWTPPWLDDDFIYFVREGEEVVGLNAIPSLFYGGFDIDPFEVREFDWAGARQMASDMNKMMAKMIAEKALEDRIKEVREAFEEEGDENEDDG